MCCCWACTRTRCPAPPTCASSTSLAASTACCSCSPFKISRTACLPTPSTCCRTCSVPRLTAGPSLACFPPLAPIPLPPPLLPLPLHQRPRRPQLHTAHLFRPLHPAAAATARRP